MGSTVDLINTALQKIGIYAPGDNVAAQDYQLALNQLKKMLDRWGLPGLIGFYNLSMPVPFQAGKQYYLIGSSGIPAPRNILTGFGSAFILDAQGYRYPVEVVEEDRWNQISRQGQQSQIPQFLFYNDNPASAAGAFPYQASAGWYPCPSDGSYTGYFTARMSISTALVTNPTVDLATYVPTGYEAAMENNLCVELKPFFGNARLADDVKELARETLADIKRANSRPVVAQYDDELAPRGTPTYNYKTDTGG